MRVPTSRTNYRKQSRMPRLDGRDDPDFSGAFLYHNSIPWSPELRYAIREMTLLLLPLTFTTLTKVTV